MANRIYVLDNHVIVSLTGKAPKTFGRTVSVYDESLNAFQISRFGQEHEIAFADIPDWYDETGLIAYTEATLRTFLGQNTAFSSASGGSGAINVTQQVAGFSNLVAGDTVGDLAYVEGSEGTAWLPGTLLGTYYPKGFYLWNGAVWTSDRNEIAAALENGNLATKTTKVALDGTEEIILDGTTEKTTTQDIADLGGSGGGEIQVYDRNFWIDSNDTTKWFGISGTDLANNEYQTSTNVTYTNSITTISGAFLVSLRPAGVAQGAQTINSFKMFVGGGQQNAVTNVTIFKANLTTSTINSISILYEGSISFSTDGYGEVLDTSFASTALSDKDNIYIFFRSSVISDVNPCFYRLKCSID